MLRVGDTALLGVGSTTLLAIGGTALLAVGGTTPLGDSGAPRCLGTSRRPPPTYRPPSPPATPASG
ncbi:hypothetical protein CNX65_11445 [Actinosynnema pretiosum]|uniref:Uncharacterized protein n=1 Tax=Actinosynnema pretiosum TaxID=42197 RepID=A0A290Z457_9PSEU|nr:hypothetical protein CNX65_11445 [Actinosynnema pretiosum]